MSMVSGRMAGDMAIKSLESKGMLAADLKSYETTWKMQFESELERGLDIRNKFLELSDDQMARLMSVFSHSLLRNRIQEFGDIDYPSKMFATLMHVSPLLKAVLNISLKLPRRWTDGISDLKETVSKFRAV